MKKLLAIALVALVLLSTAVLSVTIGITNIYMNFLGTIAFPRSVNMTYQEIGMDVNIFNITILENATSVPIYLRLISNETTTGVDENQTIFWIKYPVTETLVPLRPNVQTNLTSMSKGDFMIYAKGKKVGEVRTGIEVSCEWCIINYTTE